MGMGYRIFCRLLMLGVTALVCLRLTSVAGPWLAVGIWVAGIGLLCGVVACLLRLQPPGRVGAINHISAFVLPWGFSIGRGKLLPIVLTSWFGWALLGAAVIVLNAHGYGLHGQGSIDAAAYHRSGLMTILLLASWIIDGAVALRLITVVATRANDNPMPPGMLRPILAILALLAASITLTVIGHTAGQARLALLLTGGPIVVLGGGYGLWLLFMLTVGRKTRWN
jgi:hypothetical protein